MTQLQAITPTMSRSLQNAIGAQASVFRASPSDTDKGAGLYMAAPYVPLTPDLITEAHILIDRITVSLAPFNQYDEHRRAAQSYLDAINCAVRNPLQGQAMEARLMFTIEATRDMPACAWSDAALRHGLRTFVFFPAVADVVSVLEQELRPVRDLLARLRVIIIRQTWRNLH